MNMELARQIKDSDYSEYSGMVEALNDEVSTSTELAEVLSLNETVVEETINLANEIDIDVEAPFSPEDLMQMIKEERALTDKWLVNEALKTNDKECIQAAYRRLVNNLFMTEIKAGEEDRWDRLAEIMDMAALAKIVGYNNVSGALCQKIQDELVSGAMDDLDVPKFIKELADQKEERKYFED